MENLDSNCLNLRYHSVLYFCPQQAGVVSNYNCSLEQLCGINFSTPLLPNPPCKVWFTFLSVSLHLTHSQRASGLAGSDCRERNCAKIHFICKVCWAGQIKYESRGTQAWLLCIFIETDWQMSHSLCRHAGVWTISLVNRGRPPRDDIVDVPLMLPITIMLQRKQKINVCINDSAAHWSHPVQICVYIFCFCCLTCDDCSDDKLCIFTLFWLYWKLVGDFIVCSSSGRGTENLNSCTSKVILLRYNLIPSKMMVIKIILK